MGLESILEMYVLRKHTSKVYFKVCLGSILQNMPTNMLRKYTSKVYLKVCLESILQKYVLSKHTSKAYFKVCLGSILQKYTSRCAYEVYLKSIPPSVLTKYT